MICYLDITSRASECLPAVFDCSTHGIWQMESVNSGLFMGYFQNENYKHLIGWRFNHHIDIKSTSMDIICRRNLSITHRPPAPATDEHIPRLAKCRLQYQKRSFSIPIENWHDLWRGIYNPIHCKFPKRDESAETKCIYLRPHMSEIHFELFRKMHCRWLRLFHLIDNRCF